MRRVLWRGYGITIHSYPAMLYVGLVLGMLAGQVAARSAGIDPRRVLWTTLVLLVPALVGARLLFVARHWEWYRRAPRRIWGRGEGGLAMYGGLPLALACSVPVARIAGLPLGAFWDVATFTILVGMVFARVGCLLNGCCSGRPTHGRFGIWLADAHGVLERRVPTQVLEMGLAIALLAGAMAAWPRLRFGGELFLWLLVGYGVGRCVLEGHRRQAERFNVVVSAGMAVMGLALAVAGRYA